MEAISAFSYLLQFLGYTDIDPEVIKSAFWMSAIFIFILGTCIGSFLNVCIYRMPLIGRSVLKPVFSFCFNCGTTLQWYDNIPLISYLWLMGRCRRCGQVYSSRYFWVELLTGLIFLSFYLYYGPSLMFISITVLVSCLLVSLFTDLDEYIIPDETNLFGFLFGLAFSFIPWLEVSKGSPLSAGLPVDHPLEALLGAIVGAGSLFIIGLMGTFLFRKEAMGMGDVKLLGMMGTFIVPVNVVLTIFVGSCIGAMVGLSQIIYNKIRGRRNYAHIPFGPYLAVGGILTIFLGEVIFPVEKRQILVDYFLGR